MDMFIMRVPLVVFFFIMSTSAFTDEDDEELMDLDGHTPESHNPGDTGGTFLSSFLEHHYKKYKHKGENERKKMFRKIIPTIDTNKDQKISLEELKNYVMQEIVADTLRYDMAQAQVSFSDKNNDGKYSFEEVMKNFDIQQKLSAEHGGVPLSVLKSDRMKEELKFKYADTNKDGFLSKDEVPRMVLPEHFSDMEPMFIEYFKSEFDKNKDGRITKKEFTSEGFHMKEDFQKFDTNKDLKLTENEIEIAALHDLPLTEVKREVKLIFDMANVNKQDAITYKELSEQHKYFTDKNAQLEKDPSHDEL